MMDGQNTATTAEGLLHRRLHNRVLTLSLGRAPAHPLSLEMIEALLAALTEAGEDPDVGAIVIHGAGRIFCAGHDLKEIARHRRDADHGEAFLHILFTRCAEMMQAITLNPRPTVAMVEGLATAAGLQIVAACDMAFATPGASFCLPGVRNHGFCTTPAVAVVRAVGRKHAMELALTGTPADAEWARQAGLVNRILPEDGIAGFVQDFAEGIADWNPVAVGTGKQALYRQVEMPLEQAYEHATEVMIGHFMDPLRIAEEQARWS